MHINNYTLKVGQKVLLHETEIAFEAGKINHLLGRNGSGKSQLAKDFIINRSGNIPQETTKETLIVSSYANLPSELTISDLKKSGIHLSKTIYDLLGIKTINSHLKIRRLSDGQKQKVKLWVFLSLDKDFIILDEITNALDKATISDIYDFLNQFIQDHPEKTILFISHHLSDLR